MDRSRWPNLAQDVLRDVAGRLHDAADFARFYAVCRPWRESREAPPPSFRTTTSTHQFLPWLLTAADKDHRIPLKLRCIFSKSTYRVTSPPPCAARGNWVCSADATAVHYLTVDRFLNPSLHDAVSGQVTRLPRFQWDEGDPHGVLYGDGAILLYPISHTDKGRKASFRASLLRPHDAKWTLSKHVESCAAYYRGKILVSVEAMVWRAITPDGDKAADVLIPKPSPPWEWQQGQGFFYSHVLESRGELLWVSVVGNGVSYQCRAGIHGDRVPRLYVLVYALKEEKSTPEKMWWARIDVYGLADRVLFLGSSNSFAVDASSLDGHGGCAYFVYHNTNKALQSGAFEYNFFENKTEFVERLPPGWDGNKCTWLVPQPAIAPLQEITKRSLMAQEVKQQQNAIMVRHYEPSFTVLLLNLPIGMNSSRLQHFFSNHGKVSHAKLIYYNKTKTIEVAGLLTISTVHAHQEEALDAISGLSLDGCSLEVSLVKEEQRRRRHGRPLH